MKVQYKDSMLPPKKLELGMALKRAMAQSGAKKEDNYTILKRRQLFLSSIVDDLINKSRDSVIKLSKSILFLLFLPPEHLSPRNDIVRSGSASQNNPGSSRLKTSSLEN